MSESFQNILTTIGQQKKAAAEAGANPLNITYFKVGDSNGEYYTPAVSQADLVNCVYTGIFADNSGSQIIVNPSALNEVLYKCFIPADVGGFTVRELGLFDADDDLILLCKLPAQEKFALDSGLYQPLTFTPKIIYTNPDTQAVLTPSSQIIASQNYVNMQISAVSDDLSAHITDPQAHSILFAAKSDITHLHDDRYYTEAEINDIISHIAVPYSVNYGNTDENGYANLITKVSDTEVSFKVGGIYPNMGATFPNRRHYEISEMPNITELNDDTKYTFVIFEENLTPLEDGTYKAIATAVQIGYSISGNLPSISQESNGYCIEYLGNKGVDPYPLFSGGSFYWSTSTADTGTGGASVFVLTLPSVLNIDNISLYVPQCSMSQADWGTYYFIGAASGKVSFSSDGGNTYHTEFTKSFSAGANNFNITSTQANTIKFEIIPTYVPPVLQGISPDNFYSSAFYRCYVQNCIIHQNTTYPGGDITEAYIEPASPVDGDLLLDISIIPYVPYIWQQGVKAKKQFLKFAETTKTGGTLGAPITYAFNGKTIISKQVTVGQHVYDFNHNIGSRDVKFAGWFSSYSGGNASLISNDSSPSVSSVPLISSNITEYQYNNELIFFNNKIFRYVSPVSYLWFAGAEGTNGNFTSASLTICFERNY